MWSICRCAPYGQELPSYSHVFISRLWMSSLATPSQIRSIWGYLPCQALASGGMADAGYWSRLLHLLASKKRWLRDADTGFCSVSKTCGSCQLVCVEYQNLMHNANQAHSLYQIWTHLRMQSIHKLISPLPTMASRNFGGFQHKEHRPIVVLPE